MSYQFRLTRTKDGQPDYEVDLITIGRHRELMVAYRRELLDKMRDLLTDAKDSDDGSPERHAVYAQTRAICYSIFRVNPDEL